MFASEKAVAQRQRIERIKASLAVCTYSSSSSSRSCTYCGGCSGRSRGCCGRCWRCWHRCGPNGLVFRDRLPAAGLVDFLAPSIDETCCTFGADTSRRRKSGKPTRFCRFRFAGVLAGPASRFMDHFARLKHASAILPWW